VYVDADRVAGPRLADADFGEHAAAFLSGNFQPLSEELTAVVETGGLDEDEDEDDKLERLAPDGSFSEVFEGFVGIDSSLSDSPEEMRVVGRLPSGFPDGKFSYVGPNPKFPREHYKKWGTGPDQPSLGFGEGWHHWFEGDGMVYAVDFTRKEKENDGDDSLSSPSRLVTYRNRYVRTNSWHDELEASTRLFAPLMNASGESFLPNAVHNLFRGGSFLKDSANTALANYGGKMLALQDTMPPWELDADSLETKGACDFDGQLPFYVPFTAHPKVAPDTGHLHFFGFNPVYPPHISLGALDGDTGKMSDVTSLWHNAAQGATFMHDFCVTAKRIVLFEGSMNIRPTRMLGGKHPLMYDPKQRARFGLADRDPSTGAVVGDVRWCECSCAQMVYHFINAYECEETGNVVVTGVREDGFFHGALAANGTRQWIEEALASGDAVPRVHEWVIDPVSCEVIGERWLFDDVVEVPRINDAFAGVKNRFAYAGRVHGSSLANDAQLKFDAVVKFDLETGRSETYEHGVGRYGMEQQFVPATNGKDEDDGWLVLYVHDEAACAVACDETRCETTASTSTIAETSQGQEKKGSQTHSAWSARRARSATPPPRAARSASCSTPKTSPPARCAASRFPRACLTARTRCGHLVWTRRKPPRLDRLWRRRRSESPPPRAPRDARRRRLRRLARSPSPTALWARWRAPPPRACFAALRVCSSTGGARGWARMRRTSTRSCACWARGSPSRESWARKEKRRRAKSWREASCTATPSRRRRATTFSPPRNSRRRRYRVRHRKRHAESFRRLRKASRAEPKPKTKTKTKSRPRERLSLPCAFSSARGAAGPSACARRSVCSTSRARCARARWAPPGTGSFFCLKRARRRGIRAIRIRRSLRSLS
jgi:carotenoid cleavage dioxygenase-like enzyme